MSASVQMDAAAITGTRCKNASPSCARGRSPEPGTVLPGALLVVFGVDPQRRPLRGTDTPTETPLDPRAGLAHGGSAPRVAQCHAWPWRDADGGLCA